MSGKCTENVLRMQMKMLREVQKGIGECCVDENGDKLKSEPTKDSIIRVCRNHATMKHFKEESFEQLREKLDIEWPKKDGPLEYKKLFEEDSEGNQSAFVECLRDLNLEDREEYFEQLEQAICEADEIDEGESDGLVNVTELQAAVRKIDPHKSDADVDAFIKLGLMMEKRDSDGEVVSRQLIHPYAELPHESVEF